MNPIYDAASYGAFLAEQSVHIEQEVNKTTYPDITYAQLVPVDTSAHEMTDTIMFYSSDQIGQANWVNGNADDIPLADVSRDRQTSAVHMAGIGYGYGLEELQKAMRDNMPLTSDKAEAARYAYESMAQRVAFWGDASKGFTGAFKFSTVEIIGNPVSGKTLITATADEALNIVNTLLNSIPNGSANTSMADTLLLPLLSLQALSQKRIGDTETTVLEFIKKNNIYTMSTGQPLEIRGVVGLDKAGVGEVGRAMAYRRNPQVLKMHIPMVHRFLPAWQSGALRWEVPGIFRMGGAEARRPHEIKYMDGV